jgi:hypothetical protein
MTSPQLRIEMVNPLDHAEGIKSFIAEEGGADWSGFPDFFDRSYPAAVERGARSWIGLNGDDRIVLHWACFPHTFLWNECELQGGLMVNLVAARDQRTFFPVYRLMIQAIQDLRDAADLDFLYGIPNPASRGIVGRVGFEDVGEYGRYVNPVAGHNLSVNLLLRAYSRALRLLRGDRGMTIRALPADAFPVAAFERPAASGPTTIRPFRPLHLYQRRCGGFPGEAERWYVAECRGASEPVAHALVSGIGSIDGYLRLVCMYSEDESDMSSALLSMVVEARFAGCRRLQAWAVGGSRGAWTLLQAGFRLRNKGPLAVLPITELGREAIRSVREWELSMLDVDA